MLETKTAVDHTVTPEKTLPLTLEEAATQAAELRRQSVAHNRALYESPDGKDQDQDYYDNHPLTVVAEEVYAELGENATNIMDVFLGVRSRLQKRLEPKAFEALVPHLDGLLASEKAYSELETTYGEAMKARREATKQRLYTDVDWDRIVGILMAEDTWPAGALLDSDTVFGRLRILTVHPPSKDLSGINTETRGLQELTDFAASVDAMRAEPLPEADTGWYVQGSLYDAMEEWSRITKLADTYITGARHWSSQELLYQREWSTLGDITRRLHLTADNDVPAPEVIVAALERRVAQFIQTHDTRDLALTREDASGRPNMLYIEPHFQKELRDNTGVTNIPDWIHSRFERIGHRLTHGLGFIEFTNDNDGVHSHHNTGGEPEEKPDDSKPTSSEGVKVGERIVGENKLTIDVCSDDAKRHRASGMSEDVSRALILRDINETLDHEVGHQIHCTALTLTELRDWQEALEAEPDTQIDSYIRNLYYNNAPDLRLRREQFAATFQHYMNDPITIAFNYPRRFAVMNTLVGRYDGHEIEELLSLVHNMRQRGTDEEDVRISMAIITGAYKKSHSELFDS